MLQYNFVIAWKKLAAAAMSGHLPLLHKRIHVRKDLRMKNFHRRLAASLLSAVLLTTALPTGALAEEPEEVPQANAEPVCICTIPCTEETRNAECAVCGAGHHRRYRCRDLQSQCHGHPSPDGGVFVPGGGLSGGFRQRLCGCGGRCLLRGCRGLGRGPGNYLRYHSGDVLSRPGLHPSPDRHLPVSGSGVRSASEENNQEEHKKRSRRHMSPVSFSKSEIVFSIERAWLPSGYKECPAFLCVLTKASKRQWPRMQVIKLQNGPARADRIQT